MRNEESHHSSLSRDKYKAFLFTIHYLLFTKCKDKPFILIMIILHDKKKEDVRNCTTPLKSE